MREREPRLLGRAHGLAGLERGGIDMEQADEGIAGQEIELDVGQRFELVARLGGGDEVEEEPELRDLDRLLHEVHAVEVFGDELLLEPVGDRRLVLPALVFDPLRDRAMPERLTTANERGGEIEQRLQRGDEERTRAARGIEQRKSRQGFLQQVLAERTVGMKKQVADGGEGTRRGALGDAGGVELHGVGGPLGGGVEHELVDSLLAEVLGDLRPRVVSAEFLLVDVLFEDVAEDVGVDLLVVSAGRVVERPRVALEEAEEIFEGGIRNADLLVRSAEERGALDSLLDPVGQEESAIEIRDIAERHGAERRALRLRLREALEKEVAQEVGEEPILLCGRGGG